MTSSPKIISRNNGKLVVEIDIALGESFLECEEEIQKAVNAIGNELTIESLKSFDTNGEIIEIGGVKAYSKGALPAKYQTPYGVIELPRHVYQTSEGGKTFIPLEVAAKTTSKTTPKFAKMVSSKYSDMSAEDVVVDLKDNHGRKVSRAFVQDIVTTVGAEIQSEMEDGQWTILPTCNPEKVASISCGLDGAMMPTRDSKSWREAMTGTITFYDIDGSRLETIYVAAGPQYGKEIFTQRFLSAMRQAKQHAPEATVIGLADGAKWNWGVLEDHVDIQVLDFYHVTEYIAKAGLAMFPDNENERKTWENQRCHSLKHTKGAAKRILNEMVECRSEMKNNTDRAKALDTVITYFSSGYKRMQYYKNTINNYPIGSGVTEAACKVIVKQRMCKSGARWSIPSSEQVLIMRCMNYSGNRWNDYWKNR